MRARHTRLGRVQAAVATAPVRVHLLREAYEWLRCFGELPDDDTVAFDAVLQALQGGKEPTSEPKARDKNAFWNAVGASHPGKPETVRDRMFYEALFERAALRDLARATIAIEVAYGGHVESQGFAGRLGLPVHQSMALHALGYPGRLAIAPYEDQARRLFVRMDELRGKIGGHDAAWFAEQADAVVRFLQTGELPGDELRLEALLAVIELDLLSAHKQGIDVAPAMATCARIGNDDGEALDELCEMARAGRLLPRGRRRPPKAKDRQAMLAGDDRMSVVIATARGNE